ncbi:ATP-binding protein [Ereboglobus sp. PH5-10]|uniref:ATP-binding protein n=1 Tax=Ereboglobus sp. PH5-10 TaxID=2940629 RepID=UPI0024071785|nr:ATP-binding protein [Ereboglobus sp. PH5-10]
MIARRLLPLLQTRLSERPAVALLGPRQVGKTTLALTVADSMPSSVYLDLETESDLAKLADPELYFSKHEDACVILDEIQRKPGLFQTLRGRIDRMRRQGKAGRFLLLGSASLDLLRQSSESLAGRISHMELSPLTLEEVGQKHASALWVRGGFPESFTAKTDASSMSWRRDFIRTYLERDIPQLGPRIPAETLRRFWTMLAHRHGGLHNAATIAQSLGVDGKTVAAYLDLFVDLLLVRRLEPWHHNAGKRLVKSPKVYFRDTGLLHCLLDIDTEEDLLGHPIAGASWEGHVIENIIAAMPEGAHCYFYRTSSGAEIDLVMELPKRRRWAVEIKKGLAPTVSKGFHLGCADIKATQQWVVYSGKEAFPLDAKTTAISLAEFVQTLRAEET